MGILKRRGADPSPERESKMGAFEYEWWTVDVKTEGGTITYEFKGKNRENVIKQINKEVKKSNDPDLPWWERGARIIEVFWNTLTLDRVGYQRKF